MYSQKSFNSVEDWLKQLKNQSSPDCKVFLIGNKIDLEDQRVVETRQGETLKKNLGINMFMETSAKTISALTNIVNSMMPNSNTLSPISHSENFEQVVNINADFSGVRTADEIEKAFANMENMASQYANRAR